MTSREGLVFSLGLNKTFNTSSNSEAWTTIAVQGEDQTESNNFHQILTQEMKMIALPCLLVSVPIIILCMLVCELLYKTISNNVVPGLFRHCQSRDNWVVDMRELWKICKQGRIGPSGHYHTYMA